MDQSSESTAGKTVLVTLPPDLMGAVDRWAQRRKSSRAQVLREAAAEYLRRHGALEDESEAVEVAV